MLPPAVTPCRQPGTDSRTEDGQHSPRSDEPSGEARNSPPPTAARKSTTGGPAGQRPGTAETPVRDDTGKESRTTEKPAPTTPPPRPTPRSPTTEPAGTKGPADTATPSGATAPPRTGRPSPAGPAGPVPVDYSAFCALYRGHYLTYVQTRLHDARFSHVVVGLTLSDLAQQWPQALRSRCTRTYAWDLLTTRVEHALSNGATEAARCSEMYGALPGRRADAVVLHHLLDLPVADAAELMGITTGDLRGELRMATRSLPHLRPGDSPDTTGSARPTGATGSAGTTGPADSGGPTG